MKYTLALYVLRLIGRLPLRGARALGAMVGLLAWASRGRSYKITAANLARCFPDWSPGRRQRLVRRSLVETGKTTAEVPVIWHQSTQALTQKVVSSEGGEAIGQALAAGRGLIMLAPHLGNWEVTGPFVARYGPLTVLYQPPRHKRLHEFMLQGRTRTGMRIVPTSRRGVGQLLACLKRGETVGILPDQVPEAGSGARVVPFFGQPALTMTLVHSLIERTGCVVLLVMAERVPRGFNVRVMEPDPGIYLEAESGSVEALNRSIEAAVRLAPAQYQWEYKRFRGLE